MDDPIWDVSTFSKNRGRFLDGEISAKFFAAVLDRARDADLLSDEHFTVDGTLLEAWASQKSFRRKDGNDDDPGSGRNPKVDFSRKNRRNETHASVTDPDARLYRKGSNQGAILGYMGHALMENRHGLIVDVRVTHATGTAEREAALEMLGELTSGCRATVGADKGYDTHEFVANVRALGITPHVAQNDTNRRSAIDGRTSRHEGYSTSQRRRKMVEEHFGWGKVVGSLRKLHLRGLDFAEELMRWNAIAFDLVRLRNPGFPHDDGISV